MSSSLGDSADVKYATIVADPPWRYREGFGSTWTRKSGRRNPLPYPSMGVDEIAALPIAGLADDDAHLYLWTTNRYLPESFGVLRAWGFRYAQTLVWTKSRRGSPLGGAFRTDVEFLLFARRGTLAHLVKAPSSWYDWPRQSRHSQKPDDAYALIASVSPGPYLELFARRKRPGWDVWGNEVESDIELVA